MSPITIVALIGIVGVGGYVAYDVYKSVSQPTGVNALLQKGESYAGDVATGLKSFGKGSTYTGAGNLVVGDLEGIGGDIEGFF